MLLLWLAANQGLEANAQGRGPAPNPGARIAIEGELSLGIRYAEQALTILGATGEPSELKRAGELIIKAYLQWNRAVAGVQHLIEESRFPDPLLQHTMTVINRARETTSAAHTQIQAAAAGYDSGRAERIGATVQRLEEAIGLARQAAELVTL